AVLPPEPRIVVPRQGPFAWFFDVDGAGQAFRVLGAEADRPAESVRSERLAPDRWRIHVVTNSSQTPLAGPLAVRVRTDDSAQSRIVVPVTLRPL
ncbi:MAG: hypothetical protein MH204_03805, partial [Fimbriimonadaceae bacterium]|nr:hypothetical protein [Fimbriimonadaceae bacterium]